MINQTIAHYKITSKLGQGGMGEVYRATDTKLDRDVAIKILPETFATDANRAARFNREAKVLATLNHPHIAAIYGIEQTGDTHALVMELVEGETLSERLEREPMSVAEALECCRQIAEALEAAHEKGIIHRDLKPENVKIDPEGRVKVLDFGLAKALADPATSSDVAVNQADSPTLTNLSTLPGQLLGTAPYMSPEQARAKPVDKRSDIWSFGCVLYECLTGKPMFQGEDVTETLATIIKGEPDWTALPVDTPPTIQLLLRKCLNKDRKRRLRDIGDARIDIEQALGDPSSSIIRLSDLAIQGARSQPKTWAKIMAMMVVVGLLTGGLTWFLRPRPSSYSPPSTKRFSISLGLKHDVVSHGGAAGYWRGTTVSLSKDGSKLAYVGVREGISQLSVREMDTGSVTELENTKGVTGFIFSPDGQWILYGTVDNELRKVNVEGGRSLRICSSQNQITSYIWHGNEILFGEIGGGMMRVSAEGGTPELLAVPGLNNSGFIFPLFKVSDRNGVMVYSQKERERPRTSFLELETLELIPVLDRLVIFAVPSERLLVYRGQQGLLATRYDPDSLRPIGDSVNVLNDYKTSKTVPRISFAEDGTVAYISDARTSLLGAGIPVWVNRSGVTTPLWENPLHDVSVPRISPNGKYLTVTSEGHIHILELEQVGPLQRITHENNNRRAVWTRDSESLIFSVNHRSHWTLSKASVTTEALTELLSTSSAPIACSVSPVDDLLLYYQWDNTGEYRNRSFFLLNYSTAAESKTEPEVFLERGFDDKAAVFSPDGKWIAYVSDESGIDEVYALSYPKAGRPILISQGGGAEPVWSHLTNELFYWNESQFRSLTYETTGGFRIIERTVLFTSAAFERGMFKNANYDVHPTEDRFLMIQSTREPEIKVIVNWFTEVNRELASTR